mgnify:CR=1 FL=1
MGGDENKGGTFDFASSNPLWRATLDTLDFMSFSNVDYSGGLIITDWYSESENSKINTFSFYYMFTFSLLPISLVHMLTVDGDV